MHKPYLPKGDQKLVQILDAALADATRRSGEWLGRVHTTSTISE